ncbi:MAG: flagellar hook-associated protein FlgK [Phycisphaerales bacterium]|nr:flagellar hook-associated protein FlgK [Phycisphaerales bacterium]
MSLLSALYIANSALTTAQIGLQVTSQNLANAATPGYTRQVALMSAIRGRSNDPFMIGSGVGISEVRRQIDTALQSRLWNANSAEFGNAQQLNVYNQLEALLNEGTDFDLSSELSSFFNSWSEATTLLDSSATVANQGRALSSYIQNIRRGLVDQREQIENQIDSQTTQANALFSEIAQINATISSSENGQAQSSPLRDRRDQIVTELAQLMEITAVETNQGGLDIFVGSTPIVQGNFSRGVQIDRRTIGDTVSVTVNTADNNDTLTVTTGSIGGLLNSRDGAIDQTISKLDDIAASLIFEVNKIHSTGINEEWLTTAMGSLQISTANQSLPLNDPANNNLADLPYAPTNGGFFVNIQNDNTGTSDQIWVPVDLDGLDTLGAASVADDTSAEDIRAAIDAIPGLNASFDPSGRLEINANTGFTFSFSEDSSGALATLGVNTYFEGTNAANIAVRDDLTVMLGRLAPDGSFSANGNALLLGELGTQSIDTLNGQSIEQFWRIQTQDVAVMTSSARTRADSAFLVRQSLDSQRASVSGVSIDEESINLLTYQRQYQGAAQVITAAQEMFDTLLSLV